MKSSLQCITTIKTMFAPLGQVTARTQFGGYALSIDENIIALISEGDLYLRRSQSMSHLIQHTFLPAFVLKKRGYGVVLNYFLITTSIWHQNRLLLSLAECALNESKEFMWQKKNKSRIRDLPNMCHKMETALLEAGITTVMQLKSEGAKYCWNLLYQRNENIGLHTLYNLQGAISGQHQAVLATNLKKELSIWYQDRVLN